MARTRAGKELVIFAVGGGAWLGTIMCLLSSYEVVGCVVRLGMFGVRQPWKCRMLCPRLVAVHEAERLNI